MNESARNSDGGPDRDRIRPLPVRPPSRPEEPPPPPASTPGEPPTPAGSRAPGTAPQPAGSRPPGSPPPGQGRPASPLRQDQERRPPPPRPEPAPPPLQAEAHPVHFLVDGVEWLATAVGQGSSGRGPGVAPLVLLTFARSDRPAEPLREILCVGRDAAQFSEGQLEDFLARAKPFVRSPKRQPIFSEAKGGKTDR